MEFFIGMIAGFVIGFSLSLLFRRKKPSGTFVMDFSDPAKDICTLELDENLDSIYKKKRIILKVRTTDMSQE